MQTNSLPTSDFRLYNGLVTEQIFLHIIPFSLTIITVYYELIRFDKRCWCTYLIEREKNSNIISWKEHFYVKKEWSRTWDIILSVGLLNYKSSFILIFNLTPIMLAIVTYTWFCKNICKLGWPCSVLSLSIY